MPCPTGLERRHGRRCKGGKCSCPWQATVYSKRDKKRIRMLFHGHGAKDAAKRWKRDAEGAVERGELRAPTATTLREAAEAFMVGAKDGSIPTASGGRYKPATLRGYSVGLDKRVLPALGHKRLSDVRRADVQELADRLTIEGLSASTVQNTLDPLRAIYRRAIRRDEGVTINPTKGLELRRPDGKRERIATPSEAAALIAAVHEGERALWACAFFAGLRRGELRALRWSHIDLEARVIHVSRGWDAIEGEQDTKSAAGKRRVPILDPLAAELTAHKTRTGRDGDTLVFGRTATEPFNPETVRWRYAARSATSLRAPRSCSVSSSPTCTNRARRGSRPSTRSRGRRLPTAAMRGAHYGWGWCAALRPTCTASTPRTRCQRPGCCPARRTVARHTSTPTSRSRR